MPSNSNLTENLYFFFRPGMKLMLMLKGLLLKCVHPNPEVKEKGHFNTTTCFRGQDDEVDDEQQQEVGETFCLCFFVSFSSSAVLCL